MSLHSSSQASVLGDGGGGFCDKPFINSLVLTCQLVDKSAWQQTCKGSQTYLCKKLVDLIWIWEGTLLLLWSWPIWQHLLHLLRYFAYTFYRTTTFQMVDSIWYPNGPKGGFSINFGKWNKENCFLGRFFLTNLSGYIVWHLACLHVSNSPLSRFLFFSRVLVVIFSECIYWLVVCEAKEQLSKETSPYRPHPLIWVGSRHAART